MCGVDGGEKPIIQGESLHAVLPLGSVCGHEGQIGGDQGPLVVTDITGVRLAFHTASLASSKPKCITPSDFWIPFV